MLNAVLLLLSKGLDDLGSVLLIDLSFQELVFLFVEFDVIVEFLVLAAHLLSDVVQQIAELFPGLVETGTGLIGVLIFQRL